MSDNKAQKEMLENMLWQLKVEKSALRQANHELRHFILATNIRCAALTLAGDAVLKETANIRAEIAAIKRGVTE